MCPNTYFLFLLICAMSAEFYYFLLISAMSAEFYHPMLENVSQTINIANVLECKVESPPPEKVTIKDHTEQTLQSLKP